MQDTVNLKRHPEIICKKDNCIDKTCSDRHPKPCKHFKTGSCKFGVSCEFTHEKSVEMEQKETEDFKENDSDIKMMTSMLTMTTSILMKILMRKQMLNLNVNNVSIHQV